eukprot:23103_6
MRAMTDALALQDAYAVVIRIFGRGARLEKALDVCRRFRDAGVPIDVGLFTTVFRLAIAAGNDALARALVCSLPLS